MPKIYAELDDGVVIAEISLELFNILLNVKNEASVVFVPEGQELELRHVIGYDFGCHPDLRVDLVMCQDDLEMFATVKKEK